MAKKQSKYLTFLLDHESFGIPILQVKEIIGMMDIIHVPKTLLHIKGIINLRGKIIPVIDLRLKFELDPKNYDDRTCIIVVEMHTPSGSNLNGIVVDIVSDVLEIPEESIEQPPSYGSMSAELLTGMGKVKDRVVMLLDSDKIFDEKDRLHLEAASSQHPEEFIEETLV